MKKSRETRRGVIVKEEASKAPSLQAVEGGRRKNHGLQVLQGM
jgi:hypothetical protein